MQITECRVRLVSGDPVRGIASLTLDDQFVVKGIRILSIKGRLLVCMPSRLGPDGVHRDVAHPINVDARRKIDDQILAAYREVVMAETEVSEIQVRQAEVAAMQIAADH